jgi:MoaA/NifB/PqqE/SkfB family radical SAM enzyme
MNLENIYLLVFEITSHCNLKCPQCGRINTGELAPHVNLKHWDVDQILPNLQIDQLTNLKYVHLEGDNGDALMHPRLLDIIDAFHNAPTAPDIGIWTNGAIRSEDWWFKFGQRYNTDRVRVQFSIDGLEDTHKLYRVGADYNKAMANAKAFIQGGGKAGHRCLVFKHNEHQLEDIVAFSKEIGFEYLTFMLNDADRFNGNESWPVYEKGAVTHHIQSTTLTHDAVSQYNYNNASKKWPGRVEINDTETCIQLKYGQLHITYRGHAIPCCIYNTHLYLDLPENERFRTLVGDIDLIDLNKTSLSNVLSQGYFDRLNKMLKSKKDPGKCAYFCKGKLEFESDYITGDVVLKTITIKND